MFWFLTQPIFAFLEFIYQHVGNFGVAILLLTVVVRADLLPARPTSSYELMTKMKKVQPLMEDLRKRYKDDPAKQQQEMHGPLPAGEGQPAGRLPADAAADPGVLSRCTRC